MSRSNRYLISVWSLQIRRHRSARGSPRISATRPRLTYGRLRSVGRGTRSSRSHRGSGIENRPALKRPREPVQLAVVGRFNQGPKGLEYRRCRLAVVPAHELGKVARREIDNTGADHRSAAAWRWLSRRLRVQGSRQSAQPGGARARQIVEFASTPHPLSSARRFLERLSRTLLRRPWRRATSAPEPGTSRSAGSRKTAGPRQPACGLEPGRMPPSSRRSTGEASAVPAPGEPVSARARLQRGSRRQGGGRCSSKSFLAKYATAGGDLPGHGQRRGQVDSGQAGTEPAPELRRSVWLELNACGKERFRLVFLSQFAKPVGDLDHRVRGFLSFGFNCGSL